MTTITVQNGRHSSRARPFESGPFWWLSQILSWLLLFLVLGIVALMVVIPRIAGGESYTVLTGSMRPGLQPGDLVVVKPMPIQDIAIGSILTYQLQSGESAVVTHRVIGLSVGTDGERRFQLQGDANNVADSPTVRPVQIRGELWYSLPFLGYLNSAISGDWHMWLLSLAVTLLLSYACFMLITAWRDRSRLNKAVER